MFAILLYCKRFTAINYSLNLTFFYKFSAILLDCSLFLSGRTGCPEPRPEPDPNISPDWPEPDPNTEQLFVFFCAQEGLQDLKRTIIRFFFAQLNLPSRIANKKNSSRCWSLYKIFVRF